ncbi:unnamed protein product [Cuscuta campestris]|uniref:SOSEKI DIX-like domain-containing protein n=1 Tax=Cuscuta campestris TaxID=132261 RepID=A0A484LM81_9ASTE|nr:unnamed protein product [Cuscuta campestris]
MEATAFRHRRSDNARPRHGSRDTSPREDSRRLPPPPPPPEFIPATIRPATLKRVQVVYYLSRKGHLEHPHFMEVAHPHTRHLLLRDVMDRLLVLRGKAMPSLYSWSCKRSYKNGYVWNDLAENDVVYPCDDEGAEYILKGSELFQPSSSSSSEKLRVNDSQMGFDLVVRGAQPVRHGDVVAAKRRPVASKRHPEPEDDARDNYGDDGGEVCAEENAMGVREKDLTRTELTRDESSPPSTASSLSEKGNDGSNHSSSMRYEDGDPVAAESVLSRNSVLFQLISCGGSASFRAKSLASLSRQSPAAASAAAAVGRKSCSGSALQRGVMVRAAAATMDDEEEIIIKYMSENPRFGNMQSEEKEYFSGSIVESIASEEKSQIGPSLKKSNSYNEERKCCKGAAGLGEEGGGGEGGGVKKRGKKSEKAAAAGKCIPIKKSSSKQPSGK